MSEAVRIYPSSISLRPTIPSDSSGKISIRFLNPLSFSCRFPFSSASTSREVRRFQGKLPVLRQEGSLQELNDSPVSVELQPISSETQFDQVIAEAQRLENAVVLVWMANWCRKCIYLKPKLERLAAEYYPRLQFYCVDVNSVSHKLVARAGVTKMPTVQIWKDDEKRGEVIGGHKAYMVINEVQEMIENECTA